MSEGIVVRIEIKIVIRKCNSQKVWVLLRLLIIWNRILQQHLNKI